MIELVSNEITFFSVPPMIPERQLWMHWFEKASAMLAQSHYSPSKSSLNSFFQDCIAHRVNDAERKLLIAALHSQTDLVGFAQFRAFDREADLDFVIVDNAFRKMGIAKGLLQSGFDSLRDLGVTRILLEVSVENVPAMRLYQELSFSKIALRKGYYRTGEDAVLMELML